MVLFMNKIRIGIILFLLLGLAIGTYLAQKPQIYQKQAATSGKLTKLIYEGAAGGLKSFMPQDFNGNTWGMGWYTDSIPGITNQIFKIDRRGTGWKDPYDSDNPVVLTGYYTIDVVRQTAKMHPTNWWILGEEDNFWTTKCGKYCLGPDHGYGRLRLISPVVFAHWYHDFTNAIKQGWADSGSATTGKLIGFYFVNDDLDQSKCDTSTSTASYLDRFKNEWDRMGWGEIPIDGVDYNDRPQCTANPDRLGQIDQSKNYWIRKYVEMQGRPWLKNKFMWVETDKGNRDANACQVSQRLSKLIAWADQTPWVDAILWFSTLIPKADSNERYFPLSAASLYNPDLTSPSAGQLSVVGQTFRDRGNLPQSCVGTTKPTLTPGASVVPQPSPTSGGGQPIPSCSLICSNTSSCMAFCTKYYTTDVCQPICADLNRCNSICHQRGGK